MTHIIQTQYHFWIRYIHIASFTPIRSVEEVFLNSLMVSIVSVSLWIWEWLKDNLVSVKNRLSSSIPRSKLLFSRVVFQHLLGIYLIVLYFSFIRHIGATFVYLGLSRKIRCSLSALVKCIFYGCDEWLVITANIVHVCFACWAVITQLSLVRNCFGLSINGGKVMFHFCFSFLIWVRKCSPVDHVSKQNPSQPET